MELVPVELGKTGDGAGFGGKVKNSVWTCLGCLLREPLAMQVLSLGDASRLETYIFWDRQIYILFKVMRLYEIIESVNVDTGEVQGLRAGSSKAKPEEEPA